MSINTTENNKLQHIVDVNRPSQALEVSQSSKRETFTNSYQKLPQSILNIQNQDSMDEEPLRIDFAKVNFEVGPANNRKKILNNVSGYVLPGEIMYIMGPSGSGKTTLLDFLNNRTPLSPENFVYLNQKKWTEKSFRKIARYVQQYPVLYEVLTVEQTLEFAASFFTKDVKVRKKRVQKVMQLLGLENQKNTKIGGNFFRGISGGQKQRVSVGEQLVASPKILFLDEPTSGLDSTSAYQLMDNLKMICLKTKLTIICSIHQPSQRVFDQSDRLMFMSGGKNFGGNVVYFGKTNYLSQYLDDTGLKNDTNCSVSEWMLDQANGDFVSSKYVQKMIDTYQGSSLKELNDQQHSFTQNTVEEFQEQGGSKSWLNDLWILYKRGMINYIKNPYGVLIKICSFMVISLIMSINYMGKANEPDMHGIEKLRGIVIFMAQIISILMICTLPAYLEDKKIMTKEVSNGTYKSWVYQIVNFFISLPFTFIISVIVGTIFYYIIGFNTVENFDIMGLYLNLFLICIVSESFNYLTTYFCDDLLMCILFSAIILAINSLSNGALIKFELLPSFWKGYYYVNFNSFAFENLMTDILGEIHVDATEDEVNNIRIPDGKFKEQIEHLPFAQKKQYVDDNYSRYFLDSCGLGDVDMNVNYAVLVAFTIGYRVVAYIYSKLKNSAKK